jgi:hypothetical protein
MTLAEPIALSATSTTWPWAYQLARPADAAPLDGGGVSLHGLGVGARGGGSVLEVSPGRRCPPGRIDVAKIGTRVLWFP